MFSKDLVKFECQGGVHTISVQVLPPEIRLFFNQKEVLLIFIKEVKFEADRNCFGNKALDGRCI